MTDLRIELMDLSEEVRDHGIGSLDVNYTEQQFHEIMARAVTAVELLRAAVDEPIDGAGFWDSKVRQAMDWPEYPAKVPSLVDLIL